MKLQRLMGTVIGTVFLCAAVAVQGGAQGRPSNSPVPNPHTLPTPAPGVAGEGAEEPEPHATLEMEKKANQLRQAALKKDTDKLLKLAEELKESVDKANENVLSLNVVKKAEEIEKLAHSVKDKMKGPN